MCTVKIPQNRRSFSSQSAYLCSDDVIWRSSASTSLPVFFPSFLHSDFGNYPRQLADVLIDQRPIARWDLTSESSICFCSLLIGHSAAVKAAELQDPSMRSQLNNDKSYSVTLISQQWHQWFHCAFISVLISLFHSMEAGSTFCIYQIFVVPPIV